MGLQLRDDLGLATANALAALSAGCAALKTTFNGMGASLSMGQLLHAIAQRGDALEVECQVNNTQLQRSCKQMEALLGMNRTGRSAFSRVIGTAEPRGQAG